jgi:hypothetical protein
MYTQDILDEVERQVAERLPGALVERGLIIHAKHSYRHQCPCTYCVLKREATLIIADVPKDAQYFSLSKGDFEDARDYRNAVRDRLRVVYRAKLKDALKGEV